MELYLLQNQNHKLAAKKRRNIKKTKTHSLN